MHFKWLSFDSVCNRKLRGGESGWSSKELSGSRRYIGRGREEGREGGEVTARYV